MKHYAELRQLNHFTYPVRVEQELQNLIYLRPFIRLWFDIDSVPGENPDDIKVIIAAPTGKAVYNVHGNTLHSLLDIPPSNSQYLAQLFL